MLAFSQTPWMLPFTGLLLPLGSLILGSSKQQRAFASPRVSLLDLGIKIPLAPAQVRLSAGPQVHPWAVRELCHTVLVVHNQLFTSLLAVVYNKCQLPCLPPLYQTILMLFKEEIKSLKTSDFKCRKIEF